MNFNTDVLGYDLETQGTPAEYALQPWRAPQAAWVSAVAFTRGDTSTGSLFPDIKLIESVLTKAADQGLYVCGWNVTFDCSWLIALGLEDLAFRIKWLDSMLLWRHWAVEPEGDDIPKAKRKSYSLEAAMHEFFLDEAGFKDFKNFQTQDPEELKMLLFRCKEDTRFAVRLGELFWEKLTSTQRTAALIEARCIPQVARANVKGLLSSKENAEKLRDRLIIDGQAAREALKEAAPGLDFVDGALTPKQMVKLQAESPETNFVNLGSPKQLAELLFDTWGLPCDKMTKGTDKNPEGNRSTDKYVLYELAFKDPRARLLKEVREAKNNCTKYPVATLKSLEYNGDGYVRPGARIFSTYSSRMTYSSSQKRKSDKDAGIKSEEFQTGIALHQWKRGKDFRRLIRPPEGYGLAELDFAGQEFGWMAVASKDATMLSLREPGEDAHSYMGAQIAGIDYRELIRLVKEDDEHASYQRKLGKFCIAEGELVLTDRGLVPIEQVSLAMRVWDGEKWVYHKGVVYQGTQECILKAGLTATPNHQVLCLPPDLDDNPFARFDSASVMWHSRGGNMTPILTDYACRTEFVGVRPTYDILEAGPHHRFTVAEWVVSNSNLSFQYRVGPKTALMKARTDYEMDLDELFIKQLIATYKTTFPGVPDYWRDQICRCRTLGYAETFAGRRVQLRGSWAGREAWQMESSSINYPIQGTGGDQKYLALAVARNMLPTYNGHFYFELHDGLFFIFPLDKLQKGAEDMRKALSNLPYKQAWGVDLPITFPVDAKISTESWGDLKGI